MDILILFSIGGMINKLLMPQEFYVPALKGYEKTNLTLVDLFFQLQKRNTDTLDACKLMILIV